jgi:hypothetical protein
MDYDPFIGKSGVWFDTEPNTHYIECESPTLGLIWCVVDHWEMTVKGSSEITSNT